MDFKQLIAQLPPWLTPLLSLSVLVQIAIFIAIFPLAQLLKQLAKRPLQRLYTRASQSAIQTYTPWAVNLILVFEQALYPLSAWLLGQISIVVLESIEWDPFFLVWATPLLALWFIFRLIVSYIEQNNEPEKASLWRKQIIRPVVLFIAFLHSIGMLDDILALGFNFSMSRITIQSILFGGLVFYLFMLLARNSRELLSDELLPRLGIESSLIQIFTTFVGYGLLATGVMVAFSVMGIPLTTLTVVAGGLSVGIGFGMQEVISNFISGFILLFERSIGPGDVVTVNDTIGIVENIGIRAMRIKDFDNVELIVPNNQFLTTLVTNYTRGNKAIRVHIPVGVSYDSEPREVEKALLKAAQHNQDFIMAEPKPSVHFVDFGDNSLQFSLLVWTNDASKISALRSELRYHIWDALAEVNIEMPFPQRDLHIRSVADEIRELIRADAN
ncbi:MAG TPA: mechanosensitive ion channel domain-containing protein [Anaerolineae bacterium]|nr:mechanosensitive ion channel domain-containing protein [Anaerolineae bacterium]